VSGRNFASDNWAPVHPRVMEALERANVSDAHAYGYDPYTERLRERVQDLFGGAAEPFPVFNGTGANVLCLDVLTRPYDGVICTDVAHIAVDECGAPEKIAGCKLFTIPNEEGKLRAARVRSEPRLLENVGNEHRAQPTVLSLTQATELGTVYTEQELAELRSLALEHGLAVHVDGARFANALAAHGMSPAASVEAAGARALSFGGTKNGLMFGELAIFFDEEGAARARYLRKQNLQLASKMRYISAQFLAVFEDDLWLEMAKHANDMAALLAARLSDQEPIYIPYPVETNAVFATMPHDVIADLRASWDFYVWDQASGTVRLMTSFATMPAQIDAFARDVARRVRQRRIT
jgi:threonine aldolase